MEIEVPATRVLVCSILVLWAGAALSLRVELLRKLHIPIAITGGLLCSVLVTIASLIFDVEIAFDLSARDTLLLVFFSTIGLSAKFQALREGGRLLLLLGAVTLVFLVAQNAVGIAMAVLSGHPPGVGLIGGSVSLAGGHGTAITWGNFAADAGFPGATALGLAFATMGLVAGGLVGGPISEYLIRRNGLDQQSGPLPEAEAEQDEGDELEVSVTSRQVLRTLLLLAICVGAGSELNQLLGARGIVVPGFLTSMAVGIFLTNAADALGRKLDEQVLDLFGDVSLHLFLAMSLMSIQLSQLAGQLGSIVLIVAAQAVLIAAFSIFVIFRVAGRDYDAAVIAGGFSGLGLGATPVGIANMNAVTSRFGPSPKAFLVIPLIGAFLLDILNAAVIQGYIQWLS
jgi:ESS family glutamate:Na+ symporter